MDVNFWNQSYQDNPQEANVPDRILVCEIEDLKPGKALDLGCGAGMNAMMLAERGWSVLGLDWADIAIHIARQKAEERGVSARFEVADTTEWQPQEQFDLVISTYALPGMEAARKILRTALKALAPGGTLIVAEWDRSMASVWGFAEDELPTPEEIVALLPGLEIQKAGVLHIEDMFGERDLRASAGRGANIAFVRAIKPRI